MATNCETLVCECDNTFDYEIDRPVGATLSGLWWEIPCQDFLNPFECECENPAVESAVLTGEPGRLYPVKLLIRGIIELATYAGGSVVADSDGHMVLNPTPTVDGHNFYKMEVSDPPKTYYMNRWNGAESYVVSHAIRYEVTIQIRAGATVTFSADVVNGTENVNTADLVILPLGGEPPIQVAQPYNEGGQFLQMDCISVLE